MLYPSLPASPILMEVTALGGLQGDQAYFFTVRKMSGTSGARIQFIDSNDDEIAAMNTDIVNF